MKILDFAISRFRLVSRLIFVAFACAFIFLFSAYPALATNSNHSDLTEGSTQLLEIQRRTDKVATSAPMGLKEVQKKSNQGLNEVQGDADADKMKNPGNSKTSTSVEQKVEDFLEKMTDGKK